MTRTIAPKQPTGHSRSLDVDGVTEPSQQPTETKLLAAADGKLRVTSGPLPTPTKNSDIWDIPPSDEEPPIAEDDPPLNEVRRFHLEPDDRGPLQFIGKMVAYASVERRQSTVRTWMGLYETRGGKGIIQMKKYDGSYRNVGWEDGDVSETVRVFETVDAALASVRSAAHQRQLLSSLGRESVEFIE